MSAICAVLDWDARPVEVAVIESMLAVVPHRATDGFFRIVGDGDGVCFAAGLAYSATMVDDRTPTIAHYHDAGLTIAADASLYNLAELAGRLGTGSSGTCDVIAAGYRKWGERVFEFLDGDFAIVIWDVRKQQLVAGRDPIGVRALHYRADDRRLVIASEAKQLITAGMADAEPDFARLAEFVFYRSNDLSSSFFEQVARIAPGHALRADRDGIVQRRYWWPPCKSNAATVSAGERGEAFRELLGNAVAKRASAVSPVVAELSGGHDSTSIVALSCELPAATMRPISYTFPGLPADESTYIRAFLERYPLNWIEVRTELEGFARLAGVGMWRTDAPFADLQLPMRDKANSRAHDAGAGVVLSGFGGDEILYDEGVLSDLFRSGHFGALLQQAGSIRELAAAAAPQGLKNLLHLVRGRPDNCSPAWVSKQCRELLPAPLVADWGDTALQQLLWRWFALSGRISWAAGWNASGTEGTDLEVRFPFLDRALIEFVFAVPLHERLPHGENKRLLRQAMHGRLPDVILHRQSKTDFSSYYTLVFKKAWPILRDRVLDEEAGAGLFEEDAVGALVRRWELGDDGDWELTFALWRIACVKIWLQSLGRYRDALPPVPVREIC